MRFISTLNIALLNLGLLFSLFSYATEADRVHIDSLMEEGFKALLHDDYTKSIADYKRAKEYALSKELFGGEAAATIKLANVYHQIGDGETAISLVLDVIEKLEEVGNQKVLSNCYLAMGNFLEGELRLETSMVYREKAYEHAVKNNDSMLVAVALIGLGNGLNAEKKHIESNKKYKEALGWLAECDCPITASNYTPGERRILNKAAIYSNMAGNFWALKNYDEAIKSARMSLALKEKLGNYVSFINPRSVIYNVAIDNHDTLMAKNQVDSVITLLDKINDDPYAIMDIHELAYNFNKLIGNHELALMHYENFKIYNDSLNTVKKNLNMNTLEAKYQNKKLLEEQKTNQARLVAIGGGFCVAMIGLILVYVQKRKKDLAFKDLATKNIELAKSEKDLKALITETITVKKEMNLPTEEKTKKAKYGHEKLDEEYKQEVLQKFTKFLIEERNFTDKEISLDKVSKSIDINKRYVSAVINEKFGKSFSNILNECRVKEARDILVNEFDPKYTMEYVSQKVGFNSRQVFVRAFKKHTGITPSFFLEQLKAENKQNLNS